MLKIEHLALWVRDLEKSRSFYEKYFEMTSGEKYFNPKKNFSSYFLTFKGHSTRLELMHRPDITEALSNKALSFGLTHFAISVGSKDQVDRLTSKLAHDGFTIMGRPRTTGDGYYESVALDPDGNHVEITI
ncbi:MAG: VOC family protein [Bacteroidota bacterium]